MSRNLLHKAKLAAFTEWLAQNGIEHRPARGDFQVLQVKTKNGQWQCIFDRIGTTEHYTVASPIEHMVRKFISAEKAKDHS